MYNMTLNSEFPGLIDHIIMEYFKYRLSDRDHMDKQMGSRVNVDPKLAIVSC